MDTTTLILAAVAMILLAFAFWRERGLPQAGLLAAGQTLWRNLPILLLGFVIAGLVQVLVPKELIADWFGAQAGVKGVLVACVIGGWYLAHPMRCSPATSPPRHPLHRRRAGCQSVL
jgi:uncharacterized membrane protein YraQ (UPF0718 family)